MGEREKKKKEERRGTSLPLKTDLILENTLIL
jgi:hypothetical protein